MRTLRLIWRTPPVTEAASVDIDAWTRTYAEERARQAGMSLRDWLRHFVATEGTSAEPLPAEARPQSAPAEDALFAAPAAEADTAPEASPATLASMPAPSASKKWGDWAKDTSIARLTVVSVSARPTAAAIEEAPAEPREMVAAAPEMTTAHPEMDPADDAAMRLDGIEGALRQVCADIRAAEQATDSRFAAILPEVSQLSAGPEETGSAQAIGRLNGDMTMLMEVIDAGMERIEALAARQIADLRGEVSELIEQLSSRVSRLESLAATPAELAPPPVEAAPAPVEAARALEAAPAPVEIAPEPIEIAQPPAEAAAEPTETMDDEPPAPLPPEKRAEIFDEFAARFSELESRHATSIEPPAPSLVADAPPPAAAQPAALSRLDLFGDEADDVAEPPSVPLAALATPTMAEAHEEPLALSSDEAQVETAPSAISEWDEPEDETPAERLDGDSEAWSQDARALAAFSAANPDPVPSSRKKSGFPWLGFLNGKAA
jgi:hypothetical protein